MAVFSTAKCMKEGAAELRRIKELLDKKKQECVDLRSTAKEADVKVKEAERKVEQVEVLREKIKDGEAMLKLRNEELVDVKTKLAQSLSELGEARVGADMMKTMVDELTEQVQRGEAERAGLITEAIPYACRALVDSEELGQLIGAVITCNRDDERAMILKEFSEKGLVNLQERADYDPDVSTKIEKAVQDYRCAEFPFVEKISANPKASYRKLIVIKPEKVSQASVSIQPGSSSPAPPQGPPVDGTSAA